MSTHPTDVERFSDLDPIDDDRRKSTAMHQFWIWAGANTAPINWVLGALGISLGLSLWQTIAVLVVGNAVGMALFGLFVLMGQRTGLTQMVLSRSAFGRIGARIPAVIQAVLAVGWCAVNTWIILDLVIALLDKLGWHGGTTMKIAIAASIMIVQVALAAVGFQAIAKFEQWTVPITMVVLVVMTIVGWTSAGVDWNHPGAGLHGARLWSALSTLMTAIGIGWGITWFAYAADYSRFVPRSVSPRRLYLASVSGQFLPTVWLGILGATLATVSQAVDPGQLIVQSFGGLAIPVILLVIHGPIATNILNIYSAGLCAQAIGWKIRRRPLSIAVGAFALAFTCFLITREHFAEALDGWLAGLVTWVAPWAAIMLVHFHGIRKGRVDAEALVGRGTGARPPAVSWSALVAFAAGAAATWSFEFGIPLWLQGPLAVAAGNIDLSWFAGSLVATVVYLVLLKVSPRQRKYGHVRSTSSDDVIVRTGAS